MVLEKFDMENDKLEPSTLWANHFRLFVSNCTKAKERA